MQSFQQQLDEAFPPETDAALVRAVSQAVALADTTMENERWLKCLVGHDLRGHIRRVAVLFNVHESCRIGDLPFNSEMKKMPRGGAHWVELRSGTFRAHICRTDSPAAFPEETPTRQDERLSNQLELILDPTVVPLRGGSVDEMYAWLTFGAERKNLTHLCWGMPEANRNSWLARSNVLRRLESSTIVEKQEAPAPAIVLRFREHIEESLRKSERDLG